MHAIEFPTYGDEEMRKMAMASANSFLVDGLVSDTITLWYGQSEIGKSRFVCGFVAAMVRGEPFLNRKPDAPIERVTILCADAGGEREYARRLYRPEWAGLTSAPGVRTVAIPMMAGPEYWARLRAHLDSIDPQLVILDPMINALAGDPNSAAPVAEFYRGVRALGRPTVVVAHSSSKPGDNGRRRGSQTPIGHSSIISSCRWRVEMLADRSGLIGQLLATGNDGPGADIILGRGPRMTDFNVTSERSADEIAEDAGRRGATRDGTARQAATWLASDHPATTSAAEASRLLAARFPELSAARNKPRAIEQMFAKGTGIARFLTVSASGAALA